MTTVAVVGLGKIGLPLAAQYAGKGMRVIGCDVDQAVVDAVNQGQAHIREEPGLEEAVASAVRAGRLSASADTRSAVGEADVVVVIVPLIVAAADAIDYSNVDAATRAVGRSLRRGALVVYETTLPVGTTRHRLAPMLEEESGLAAGTGFHLAFSPERVYAGRIFEDLRRYPKIVGGVDEASTAAAVDFYRSALDAEVWAVANTETAEFAKLAETTYRDVNIALANQLALYAASRDVDVAEAFKAANSQPFSHLHRPSLGVGGHCIPVYPRFLLGDATNGELSLVREGRQTNDRMAEVGIGRLERLLGGLEGKHVLVLGASYREDVKELAFSTVFPIVELLHRGGAQVTVVDPLFEPVELRGLKAEVARDAGAVAGKHVDAVVVQAWHSEFRDLDWSRFEGLKVVLDGRGSLDADTVRRAGATYVAIGTPEG
ncbi:MAG: nucleotide sugar dehydrogenase [Chloroflexi bacterium]|nr:MAG: nucleotide sugar dehydrogenase [Chloroflexota bacterium]